MFDVSPPKPCSYVCGSSPRAWLNSIIASPSARTSSSAHAPFDHCPRAGSARNARRIRARHRRAPARRRRPACTGSSRCRIRPRPPPSTAPCCRDECHRRRTPACRFGSTARHACSAAGTIASAGNIFSPSAPAASAANASVGVATPGRQTMPSRFASRITAVSACGITIRRPPASRTRATSAASITVPAPTRQRSPNARRRGGGSMSNGCGELSGTSRMRKPSADERARDRRRSRRA